MHHLDELTARFQRILNAIPAPLFGRIAPLIVHNARIRRAVLEFFD